MASRGVNVLLSRASRMKTKLQSALEASVLEVEDVSYQHAGHAAVKDNTNETHFNVKVVSTKFDGQSLVKRHRMIYDLLGDELESGLHAISIVAKTPKEKSSSHCMDKKEVGVDLSEDLTRESLIAISYHVPDNNPSSGGPKFFNREDVAQVVSSDHGGGSERYRSKLISISNRQSPDAKGLPLFPAEHKVYPQPYLLFSPSFGLFCMMDMLVTIVA